MISLIIPCFNEEESLPLFYPEATSVLQKMNCDYELIFVNDGSKDRTLAILKELSEKDPHVIYLSFSRNFGKEAAMSAMPVVITLRSWTLTCRIRHRSFRKCWRNWNPENMTALPPGVSAAMANHPFEVFLPGNSISLLTRSLMRISWTVPEISV